MLQVSDLNSGYGPAQILFDVSLQVGAGEVVALLGRNGAGKSTTLKSIMGLTDRRKGKILFRGTDISQYPPFKIARLGRRSGSMRSSPISPICATDRAARSAVANSRC